MSEIDLVRERYARRRDFEAGWDALAPHIYLGMQEKERALIKWMSVWDRAARRTASARHRLRQRRRPPEPHPAGVRAGQPRRLRITRASRRAGQAAPALRRSSECGDALEAPLENASIDVVMQSTVFTSLLAASFQQRLAARMWSLARPGGGILWFDFVYDNPRNPDVRSVPRPRVRELFPHGEMVCWRVMLASPIARRVARITPTLYAILDALPFLRTHVLCWIAK
jgi:hypothetical protein